MNPSRRTTSLRYGFAIVGVVAATALRQALDPLLGERSPFLAFTAVVVMAAWYGGLGPSLLSLALGWLAAVTFILQPRGILAMQGFEARSSSAMFGLVGLAVALMGGAMHRARRQAEASAAEAIRQEEQLRVTLISVGDAVLATDVEGRVVFLNPAASTLTGWTQEAAKGQPVESVFGIVDESSRLPAENPVARAIREGAVVGLANHTILIARDGTERAIDDSAAPIRDGAGTVTGAVLVFRDVDERRRSERALVESEARKAAVLKTSLDAIITIDGEGNVVEFNPAAETTFGYARSEVIGREMCGLIIPPSLREAHRRGMARYLATGEGPVLGRRIEINAARADGTEFPVELAITRISAEGPALFTAHVRDISERKRIEKDLRESEERFRGLMEQAPFSIQVFDTRGKTLRVNRAWEELWGVTLDQIADYNILEDPQLEAKGVLPEIRRAFAGEAAVIPAVQYDPNETIPDRTRHRDPRRWVSAVAYPLKDADGRLREVVLVQDDISARREAEEALLVAHRELEARVIERTAQLSETNQFLGAILEHVQDGIVACDAGGTLTLFNRATREFHGLPSEPMPPEFWAEHYDLYNADGQTRMTREEVPLFRALRGEQVSGVEMVIVPKHGRRRTVLASGRSFRDDRGEGLGAVVSMHDISARKHAEEALRKANDELELRVQERTEALREADRRKGELLDSLKDSEERFRTMAESIPQLAWMARPDGHIYWYNRRWHEYTGTTREEMEGWGWEKVHDPDVLPRVMERWRGSIESGEPFDMVFPLKGADGRFRPFLTRVMPVWGEDGRVSHWFGTNTDISDRLRIEEELREAKDEAEAANRAKTQFLAVLSHELRTPLNPILLAASSMLDRPADPDEIRPTLEMIRQNVNLQARLIDDLLDVMRIVRGKMPLHWGVADCHDLIRHALTICRSEFHGKELDIKLELAAEHRQVNADSARLQQVLWNLFRNATKFTPAGGTITIRTYNEPDPGGPEDRIAIEVGDTGIGIEADVLPRIFDPFQQGETTITRKFGGLGLGLAICKGIVDAHGGTLVAESEGKDRGTTFRVVLRTLPEPAIGGLGEPPEGPGEPAPASRTSLRILVVEDEPATLRLMARLLRGLGHAITTANAVASAYEAFEAGEFDLIVSDIGLPDGTGLELIRRAVALRGHVPAIALTGYGMEEDIVRSREAGFSTHMTKPIDFTKLEAMIRQVVP